MTFKRNDPRLYKLLLLAGLLLLLLWLGLKGWRVAQAARSLQARQAEAESLLEGKVLEADPEATEALVLGLRRDIVILRDELGFLAPVAPAFSWLPRVGPLLADAPAFLEMADAGSEAATYAMRALKPALVLLQGEEGEALIPSLLPILAAGEEDLARADVALQRAVAARAEIEDVEGLPWRVRTLLEQLDAKLYLAEMVPLLRVAPEILGANGPRTYLILAQNEDEVRATGGFLTGAGLFTVDQGEIGALHFIDSNRVDAWQGGTLVKPYNPPPAPLAELMGLSLFLFRDANFWPDFPTSAEQAVALYRYGQDAPPVDGVIALDQQFLSLLLTASGPPLPVPELGVTVSGGNVVEQIRQAWEEPATAAEDRTWAQARKDFLGPLAEAVKTRLLTEFQSVDPLYFAENLYQALSEKHLQLYIRDPAVAAQLDRLDWDGRLEGGEEGDLLLPLDSNMGYNKVGPNIATTLAYEVTLDEEGRGAATTTLTYTHGAEGNITCRQGEAAERFTRTPNYKGLTTDCFWNYLRLYLPQGTTLLEGSEHPLPPGTFSYSEGWPGGAQVVQDEPIERTVVANFFLLHPGETLTSSYRYQLPPVVEEVDGNNVYRLILPRQPGANPRQATVRITLPEGARLQEAKPAPSRQSGQTVSYEQLITTDFEIEIVYER